MFYIFVGYMNEEYLKNKESDGKGRRAHLINNTRKRKKNGSKVSAFCLHKKVLIYYILFL